MAVIGDPVRIDYGVHHVFLYRGNVERSHKETMRELICEIGNMIMNVTPKGKAFLSLVWLIGFAIGFGIGLSW